MVGLVGLRKKGTDGANTLACLINTPVWRLTELYSTIHVWG